MTKLEANNVFSKEYSEGLGSLCILQSSFLALQGCRCSRLQQWTIPPPSSKEKPITQACAASLQRHVYLVFDHFHADHQAFPTDVANDLVLVSELGQFCHEMGADLQAVLLQTLLPDSLWNQPTRLLTKRGKTHLSRSGAARGTRLRISSTGPTLSHIQHRWSDGSGHWVSPKGVEVNSLVKRGCNFCKTK